MSSLRGRCAVDFRDEPHCQVCADLQLYGYPGPLAACLSDRWPLVDFAGFGGLCYLCLRLARLEFHSMIRAAECGDMQPAAGPVPILSTRALRRDRGRFKLGGQDVREVPSGLICFRRARCPPGPWQMAVPKKLEGNLRRASGLYLRPPMRIRTASVASEGRGLGRRISWRPSAV